MFVKFWMGTNYVGQGCEEVYEVPDDTTEDTLNEYAYELARDNAEMYGALDDCEDGIEDEGFEGSWEVIEGKTREEIEEEYGSVCQL